MKKIIFSIFALAFSLALVNCGEHSHDHSHDGHNHSHEGHDHSHDSHEPINIVAYGDSVEVFAEVGKLHEGEETFILAHVTHLSNYKPVEVDEIAINLMVAGKSVKSVAKKLSPGMYRCNMKPESAGEGYMIFKVPGSTDAATAVTVFDAGHHHHGAEAAHAHGSNMVTFTKEQSWKIDFAVEKVAARPVNRVVKGVARLSNAPENVTTIVAATSGRVRYNNAVAIGRNVKAGETLFIMETGDVTDDNAALKFAEAESSYNYAKAEYERKRELVKTQIVSLSEFQAVEASYLQAKAVYENLNKNFKSGKMFLKSPAAGYISDIAVASGDYVAQGTPLATLQRDGELQLFCELSVRHASALRNVTDVNIELNDGTCYSLAQVGGRIAGIGRAIQNDCNMIPVTVMVKNLPGVVPGNVVNMYLVSPSDESAIVVPRTALVEEMGRLFVFVQHNPVTFEKRLVTIGANDGKNVQILTGVQEGERVVTNGAVSLKLSQGAGALDPHAGHVH